MTRLTITENNIIYAPNFSAVLIELSTAFSKKRIISPLLILFTLLTLSRALSLYKAITTKEHIITGRYVIIRNVYISIHFSKILIYT